MNELLLIASVFFIFGSAIFAYRFFGKTGLYCLSVIAMILANIEVLIMIRAFGMDQTLGNVLFAVTFLITDILSECEGKKAANKAVYLGLFASVFFLCISQGWMLYTPSETDWVSPSIQTVFSNTPRMMIASVAVYAISQLLDVWLYHRLWALTERACGSRERFLWVRNNASTLTSQLVNTALYTTFAFWGTYEIGTLVSIFISSYVIYIVTSLLDTPALYLARRISKKRKEQEARQAQLTA